MPDSTDQDPGLETLLELNGEVFLLDNGYWTKIEAWRVKPSDQIPHGVRYSLTLHDSDGKRIIGFDNAHRVKPKGRRFGTRKIAWDHRHTRGGAEAYEFENAGQLLQDFWTLVDKLLK